MKNKCNIIKDILPLYTENLVSEDTRIFIEEHIEECRDCKRELENIQKSDKLTENISIVPLKKIKKKMLYKRLQSIILTAAIVFTFLISAFSFFTAPQYMPYSEDIIEITENYDEDIVILNIEGKYNYFSYSFINEETDIKIHSVDVWTTIWDSLFKRDENQHSIIINTEGEEIAIFYAQNNGEEDVLIYGKNPFPNGGIMSLPRLTLNYYFAFAVLLIFILLLFRIGFRKKEKIKARIEKIIFLPLSYIFAYFITQNIQMQTYSMQRDFAITVLLTLAIYCVFFCLDQIYKRRKRKKEFENIKS